jgi:hypothetical protein
LHITEEREEEFRIQNSEKRRKEAKTRKQKEYLTTDFTD